MPHPIQTTPTLSRRWTLAATAAATVAVAGAALAWHGHANAFGPGYGHHRQGGWERMDPGGRRWWPTGWPTSTPRPN